MKTVRIAMLGSGFVAEFYMQGLANVNGQQVVLNYSRSRERAESFAGKWGIAEATTGLERAVCCNDIDLFVIALPNEEHESTAIALAQAGRNQVCTKPLGRNRREAEAMWRAAEKGGALHGYAETEVFAPAVTKARETIENGGIGRVLWVRSRESHSGPHSPHFWDVAKTGGGALNDLGCHCIEAARYFYGKDDAVVEVMAWGDRLVHHFFEALGRQKWTGDIAGMVESLGWQVPPRDNAELAQRWVTEFDRRGVAGSVLMDSIHQTSE